MFPGHENLLPAYLDEPTRMTDWVRKPPAGTRGGGERRDLPRRHPDRGGRGRGEYGGAEGGYVYQELCELPDFDGWHPVIGAWVVGNSAAGMGIRESRSLITDNQSKFQPHYMWTSSPDQETIAAWLREK